MVNSPIGNNNSAASPHFGVAAPQDVSRIDILYGPFAARYAGNSTGVTVNITTRMPDRFELYADATGALQTFNKYSTDDSYGTWQLAGGVGDRYGAFSWRLSANHLDSHGQPLGYATLTRPAATSTAGTVLTGAFHDFNRTGAPIMVIGDTGLEHQVQDTDTLKLTYDFANGMQLSYLASLFHQDNDATVRTYLSNTSGHTGLCRQQQYRRLQLQHRRQHLLQQSLQCAAKPAGAGLVVDIGQGGKFRLGDHCQRLCLSQ
jgi:iron complex outermembrane receptor protein